ncbi:MAG: GNAT family N-acetyltransferase, partial [Desulfobacteraceae bacterium]|nr:GNAT family N-acetyltransferase [Desulfobacteraceae bacterium]
MDHDKMQTYVNVDYQKEFSIVGLVVEKGNQKIIAEARMVRDERTYYGEVAFLIDERFQGIGIGSYMLSRLIEQAREQGFKGLTAEVLADNQPMIKVFEKAGLPMKTSLSGGIYHVTLRFVD